LKSPIQPSNTRLGYLSGRMEDYELALSAFRACSGTAVDDSLAAAARGLLTELDSYGADPPQCAAESSRRSSFGTESVGSYGAARRAYGPRDKENGDERSVSPHRPEINARSRQLAGERHGGPASIAERLLEAGREKDERRRQASAEAECAREQREAVGARHAPKINEVSAQLMRDRRGACTDRLYASAKSVAERVASQRQHEETLSRTFSSQLPLSEVTRRIAAEMPGREGPISERLYNEGLLSKLALARSAIPLDDDPHRPTINAASRALAGRVYERIGCDASAPVHERLLGAGAALRESWACASQQAEPEHTPEINARSERLAMKRDRSVRVEDRLIAKAPVLRTAEEPEHRPSVNRASERILSQRGPTLPLEQRLQTPVGKVRESTLAAMEVLSHSPDLSAGTRRLLSRRRSLHIEYVEPGI